MKKQLLTLASLLMLTATFAQVKLHPDLSADTSIEYYEISPDGSTVVYIADRDEDDVFELYSVSIQGGANTKLNGTLVDGGDVDFNRFRVFRISSDSQRVVYIADQETDGTPEIYSVPINGGTVTKLNGTLAGNDGVRSFQVSPDGQTVVYIADELDNFDDELYSVPITGGPSTKISQDNIGIGDVNLTFHISPDGQWVVYVANADDSSTDELYSVPINGGTINKLNGTIVDGGDVEFNLVFISEDSQRVVYGADQDTRFVIEAYSSPINGGSNVKLNDAIDTDEDVERIFISPDNQWVVYVEGSFIDQDYEIYSVPIAGGTVNQLNGSDIDFDGDGSLRNSVQFSADSDLVFFRANTTNFNDLVPELFAAPIDGSTPPTNFTDFTVNNSRTSISVLGVTDMIAAALLLKVIFQAALQGTSGIEELLVACLDPDNGDRNLDNVTVTRLNVDLVSGGNVTNSIFSPDESNVIYRADQETNNVFELYTVPTDGNGPVIKLNGALVSGGDVVFERETANFSSFDGVQLSSDGSRVVYMADQDTDGIFELYSVNYANTLSTEDLQTDAINLFNDRQGNLHIKGVDQKASVEIYSILGSRVFTAAFDGDGDNSIAVPNVKTGIYIVRLLTENGQSVSKKMVFKK